MGATFKGHVFHIGDCTILADGMRVYSVYVNGKAPLNGGGANGVPAGTYVGRVWETKGYGWVAAPLPVHLTGSDSWAAEVDRSIRYFRTRRDACLFLHGFDAGVRRTKHRDAIVGTPLERSI